MPGADARGANHVRIGVRKRDREFLIRLFGGFEGSRERGIYDVCTGDDVARADHDPHAGGSRGVAGHEQLRDPGDPFSS
jgi:hypothetical protein